MMALAVAGIERSLGERIEFLSTRNGLEAVKAARRYGPAVVVADEISSPAGAFSLAKDLRGAADPFTGIIVILLARPHDAWLARWSGADAWFVKPADPFALADGILELLRPDSEPGTAPAGLSDSIPVGSVGSRS